MMDLRGRSLLTLMDYSKEEIEYLLEVSKRVKEEKKLGNQVKKLHGKNIALIFEKDSTRTRCSFEVAAYDLGAHITYLGPSGSQIGKKESIKDTARVLGRIYDAIEYRGYSQRTVETLAKYSGIPVWNGLTDEDHPTQVLADFLTLKEHIQKPLNEISFAYLGDGRNNMANALMIGASKIGMNFKIISPKELFPDEHLVNRCKEQCKISGGNIKVTSNVDEVKDMDVLYTDVWVSMGEDDNVWKERIDILKPYQINMEIIKKTQNDNVKFMHCLPAFHNLDTVIGKKIYERFGMKALEVTDEVFEGPYSIVFDEAENRLHTTKALMLATIG
ncbi:ornithine carbamoyltransferase [Clostridium botulinum]|uniref:Ornithine carbamoyltransferase n=2 Tax=Clostridium botulinum TaxID=1491 RepID=A0A0A0IE36_CLOBO|nr:ornithine carbamoyltransferase [Clostridium botulinum C/D str. BKT75002]KEI10869.1 ornithine carbamoyltransferase [Clostridium botulinum C/D str. BKT2873]KGM93500.1 ornithine carbamoyltransferase [Clostridium botulinum D str. CCUG 7971]KGM97890.1 ornithine carbamoyltransferase [Clostridium botulinum C/D str. DC5]KOC49211.1 ornithine carbamoyltransferase [Clostridium botulinum]